MASRKSIFIFLISLFFIYPLSAYSSRKKVKDDTAALERQQELMEKRARAEAEIAARKEKAEREEQERLEQERLEAERQEAEKLEAERLEAERIAQEEAEAKAAEEKRLEEEKLEAERIEKEKAEKAALQQKKEQEMLQAQMEKELENQKKPAEKNRKVYLSDYMVYDIETIDDVTADDENDKLIAKPDVRDAAGRTLLMNAAKDGKEKEIKLLIKSGANVNLKDKDGWTALMYAVRYSSNLECTESLLEAGADISVKNKYDSSALVLASCYNENHLILSKLLSKYKSSDKEVLRSLVFLLSEQNISEKDQLAKLRFYIDQAVPLNVLYEGKTPLMYAAEYGNSTKIIKLLIDNQALPLLRSTEGKTAFDYAMDNNNLAHDETYWALNIR